VDRTRGNCGGWVSPAPVQPSSDRWPHGDTKDFQGFCRRLPHRRLRGAPEHPLLRRVRYLPIPRALAGIRGRFYGGRPRGLRPPRFSIHERTNRCPSSPAPLKPSAAARVAGCRTCRRLGRTHRGAVADPGFLRIPRLRPGYRHRADRSWRFPGRQPHRVLEMFDENEISTSLHRCRVNA
jgi:hypothetical protein